jgi:hypothetical protein
VRRLVLNSAVLGQCPLAHSCEHSSELSDSITGGNLLTNWTYYWLFKDADPWSSSLFISFDVFVWWHVSLADHIESAESIHPAPSSWVCREVIVEQPVLLNRNRPSWLLIGSPFDVTMGGSLKPGSRMPSSVRNYLCCVQESNTGPCSSAALYYARLSDTQLSFVQLRLWPCTEFSNLFE